MHFKAILLVALLYVLSGFLPLVAADLPDTYFIYIYDSEFSKQIDLSEKRIKQLIDQTGIPGASVAVFKDNRIIWSETWGYADLENQVPVTNKTRFRIASISKSITTVAAAILYEEGKLNWDDPVQKYVPYFPEKRWPMSIRHVAGHIGGVRSYRGNEYYVKDHCSDFVEALSVFSRDTLVYEPGTQYLYSSYGTNVIGAVVEGASGKDFLPYLQETIFDPLNLESMVADHVDSLISNRASPYVKATDGIIINAPFVDNSHKWAGGGLLASAEDLVKYGAAVMNGEILKPETVELLWRSQKLKDGTATGYGIGWSIWTMKNEVWYGHGGGPVGGTAMLFINPEKKLVYALLCNLQSAPIFDKNSRIILDPFLK